MSSPKVVPLLFRTLDEETVTPAPFLRVDGAVMFEAHDPPDNDQEVEPPPTPHRSSVFPSAPQEHAPLAEGGLRPSVIALSPVHTPVRANVETEETKAQISEEKRAFSEALLDIATLRARALREAEQGLTDLAVRIAQAILERELAGDPTLHLALVRATLSAFGDVHQSKLRASPRTYDAIVEVQGEAVVDFEGVKLSMVRDPSIEGLGCVVEGEVNLVDGRVEERLAAVWRAFRAENQRRASEETR